MRPDRGIVLRGTVLPSEGSPAELFAACPASFLRRSGGRETFLWRRGLPRPVIVKRMNGRGGQREHENLEALQAGGLPVPRPISWSQEGARFSLRDPLRSLVVMEVIAHAGTLRDRLGVADLPERERWSEELLDVVTRLHERGWYHRDLYLQHFLVERTAGDERLVLIDVGRARRRRSARRRWFVKDLAALLHSCPSRVGPRERLRFLSRYLDRRGIRDRSRRRSWALWIERKSARMAAHVPRDERAIQGPLA